MGNDLEFTTFEEGLRQAGLVTLGNTPLAPFRPQLSQGLEALVRSFSVGGARTARFKAIGGEALAWLAREWRVPRADALRRVERLVLAKQHDYGHGNILKFGTDGLVVRMSDKYERLQNLEKRGGESATNEPLEDTYMDLVGYSMIGLMLEAGTFELPLAADLAEQAVA